jgi:hypothetical protein
VSIFGSIVSKIFGHGAQAATSTAASPAQASGSGSPSAAPVDPGQAQSSVQPGPAASAQAPVDVTAIMDEHVRKSGQDLDWRKSIVDMMKALGLDSSFAARKALAQELHYSGDMNDSASMNIWLHKQVMQKLAANGGKVPDDLKS